MLENDIILARYLDSVGNGGVTMPEADVAALDRLLDLADNELWDLLSGRTESVDDDLKHLVRQLRAL